MTQSTERGAIEKALGRRDLDCGCCSAVDDEGLNDLIAEVLGLRDARVIAPGWNPTPPEGGYTAEDF